MANPVLSIYVPVYNHEKYIEKALDSILMQKTRYSYEVLVGEDCSTDNTRKILKAYEAAHPGKLQVFYRERNTYQYGPIPNVTDLKMRMRGKYVIGLEGDDYWTDPNKIETQIRFLEEHPDFIAVAHNCVVVDENSNPRSEVYPECLDGEYTLDHIRRGIMPGQLTTIMYRNVYKGAPPDSFLYKPLIVGDWKIAFYLVLHGKVQCIQKKMSAYRYVTTSGSSFSATYKSSFFPEEQFNRAMLEYAKERNDAEAIMCAEFYYFCNLTRGLRRREISIKETIHYFKIIDDKQEVIQQYILFRIKKHILRVKTLRGYREDGKVLIGNKG